MRRQGLPTLMLRPWVPYSVLIVGLVLTLAGALFIDRTSRARDRLAFETVSDETRHLIEIRLNTYIELLRAGAALFASSSDVTADEFRAFTRHLRIRDRYPGIQGIGFAAYLRSDDLAASPGPRDPRRFGLELWPPGEREEYTSIVFLEPPDARNVRALGFDMLTEPVRRAAMERARDTGEPAASGRVTLVQETGEHQQAGFLIYMPIYRNGARVDTIAERRAALAGYVFSPFRGDDLFDEALSTRKDFGLGVYDGTTEDAATLLHQRRIDGGTASPALRRTVGFEVAGRRWRLAFNAPRHFSGTSRSLLPLTAAGGVLMTLALFLVMRAQLLAWQATTRMAEDLGKSEEALRESGDRLRRLVVLEREARAEAQQADRAKDEFLATLSHELRTPLNAMLGWISMLRSGKVSPERRDDALAVIDRNARVQAKLIEDLLDVSRIITGKIRLDVQPLDFGPIVLSTTEALRPAAEHKGVQLRVEVAPGLPQIDGDASRLQQIVWNLLSNAIKFTPSGGDVFVSLVAEAAALVLRVRDTGIGIPPEFLPHVFERFRQADSSTTRAHSGVGLGLAIVRHLIELHGGTIEAVSGGHNEGALFVARFPASAHGSLHVA